MIRILLLDCSEGLRQKLASQGFHVESGTVGHCTGIRKLPSQVYEKDVFIYNPESCAEGQEPIGKTILTKSDAITDLSPEYKLSYLQERISFGATFVAFVNPLFDLEKQNKLYGWIPFMPPIESTSDKVVVGNPFSEFPDLDFQYLRPIITTDNLLYPVIQKLKRPKAAQYPDYKDVFDLFWNGHSECLGVMILRGRGALIVLPKFTSNEEVIDTFLHRVAPRIYPTSKSRDRLADLFKSPAETSAQKQLDELLALENDVRGRLESTRVARTTATRGKLKTIAEDETAKLIQTYYDHALQQGDAALYYLYKILEAVENKFGGEAAGISALGEQAAWKAVKRLANESYRDARHAPKPGDVIKKWSNSELKQCFEDTQRIVMAYYMTLF